MDVYQSWHRGGSKSSLRLLTGVVVSCVPTVVSHFAVGFLYTSVSFSVSLLAPLLLSESIDFSRAGNEAALTCNSQQERRTTGREGGRGSSREITSILFVLERGQKKLIVWANRWLGGLKAILLFFFLSRCVQENIFFLGILLTTGLNQLSATCINQNAETFDWVWKKKKKKPKTNTWHETEIQKT